MIYYDRFKQIKTKQINITIPLPPAYYGVIHKPRGHFFGYFDPPPPFMITFTQKANVIKWSFG